jgi:hypothetical protein
MERFCLSWVISSLIYARSNPLANPKQTEPDSEEPRNLRLALTEKANAPIGNLKRSKR